MIFCKNIEDCLERIKGYCAKQRVCEHCRFSSSGECTLMSGYVIPADWKLPRKEVEHARGKNES